MKQTTQIKTNSKSKKPEGNGRVRVPDRSEEIAKLAYQYFVDRGCQHGYDQEDWRKAEEALQKNGG